MMMTNSTWLTLFLALSILQCELTAQPGFNRYYNFESAEGAVLVNMLYDNDTIIGYGLVKSPELFSQQGIALVKFDTLGDIGSIHTYFDSLEDHIIAEPNYDIIKTLDGGYSMTGQFFIRNWGFLLHMNSNGITEFIHEYPDSINKNTRQRKLVEISDGYIISGIKQRPNFKLDIYATRSDTAGNQLWDYYFGEWGEQDFMGSLIKMDDSTFVIGGGKGVGNPDQSFEWRKSQILTIDGDGSLVHEWEGEEEWLEGSMNGLNRTSDNGWIFATHKYLGLNAFNSPEYEIRLVRLDSLGNRLWSNNISETPYYTNNVWDIKPSGDGNWIGVGKMAREGASFSGGWIFKFDNAGTVLWSRVDTAYISGGDAEEHVLCGLSVLPSGSIVACGYFKNYAETPIKSYAWLIKTDANGCIDSTDCAVTGVTEPWTDGDSQVLYLYPNPATYMLYLSLPGYTKSEVRYSITDPAGRKVAEGVSPVFREQVSVVVEGLADGMYFISIMEDGTGIRSLKFVKKE
jgi:hypothetical protein